MRMERTIWEDVQLQVRALGHMTGRLIRVRGLFGVCVWCGE